MSGTLYSTATLLNSTAGGMSYLSGDASYMQARHVKRLKQQARRGGALAGLKDGGAAVVSGVASGELWVITSYLDRQMSGRRRFFYIPTGGLASSCHLLFLQACLVFSSSLFRVLRSREREDF